MTLARALYVLVDSSGSTVRDGFGAACAQVLPMLVNAAAQRPGAFISVLAYATRARTLIGLSDPSEVSVIPLLTPGGLSSLAAGLHLLAEAVSHDVRQLAADGIDLLAPDVLVLADGLPTDQDHSVLSARRALSVAVPQLTVPVCVMPAGMAGPGDALGCGSVLIGEGTLLSFLGLAMDCRPIEGDTPDALAAGIFAVFESMLDGGAEIP